MAEVRKWKAVADGKIKHIVDGLHDCLIRCVHRDVCLSGWFIDLIASRTVSGLLVYILNVGLSVSELAI